jgi:imidazolonepropionase-like amidohydrolase
MKLLIALICVVIFTGSCKPPEESRFKAIVGAVLVEAGKPPLSRSVIVVAGNRIRGVGEQANVPIPAGSDKVDGSGKFLIAAPVSIPTNLPKITSLADAKSQADSGAFAFEGMIADTEDIDAALLHKLRDLRIVFVPKLSSVGTDVTRRNTKKLADAGVPIAADNARDWEALKQIGLTPEQILASATHNAARAAKLDEERGAVRTGFLADVLLLKGNPLEDSANLSKIETAIAGGEWVK